MRKELVEKILATLFVLIGLVGVIALIILGRPAKMDGKFYFQVADFEENKVINEVLYFQTGDTLLEVLEREEHSVVSDTKGTTFVLEIDSVKTDGKEYFFTIYVDGKMSSVGVDQIELKDGMVLLFQVTKYDPNYEK